MKKPTRRRRTPKNKAHLLGLGLDSDGHKRITTGEQFLLLGGTEETHGRMTETAIKTFEELKRRGKHLAQIDPDEFHEIVSKATPK